MEAVNATHIAPQETSDRDPDVDLSMIPMEYHEFADLFSKTEANKLLALWLYDYAISLEPGKATLFG